MLVTRSASASASLGRKAAAVGMVAPAASAAQRVSVGNGAVQQQSRGLAANPNDIKKRIKSTQSIKKITKSMKMVSAAKLRGDQTRLERGIVFGRSALSIIPEKPQSAEEELKPTTSKKTLVAVLSSDKGLCGGINSFATKMARQVIADAAKVPGAAQPGLVVYGGKSEAQMRRTYAQYFVKNVDECFKNPMNFATASGMASELIEAARQGEYEEIALVYNHFKSLIKYETTVQRMPNIEQQLAKTEDVPAHLAAYELEPDSQQEAIQNLFEFTVATTLFGAAIDNAASEQSSRMAAMDNASKNASDMIDKLTLIYNRARQAKITTGAFASLLWSSVVRFVRRGERLTRRQSSSRSSVVPSRSRTESKAGTTTTRVARSPALFVESSRASPRVSFGNQRRGRALKSVGRWVEGSSSPPPSLAAAVVLVAHRRGGWLVERSLVRFSSSSSSSSLASPRHPLA